MTSITSKKTGAIVLMDVLGTKQRWNKSQNIQKIFDSWEEFLDLSYAILSKTRQTPCMTKMSAFSDTILISYFSKNPSDKETKITFSDMVSDVAEISAFFFVMGLGMNMPFRGCVSFGDFFTGSNSITGPAIFEAADYYEKPNWIGLSLTPSAHRQINNPSSGIVKYDIPLKNEIEKDGLAINIQKYYKKIQQSDLWKPKYQNAYKNLYDRLDFSLDLKEKLEMMTEETNDLSATLKIRNTLAFVKYLQNLEKNNS